MCFEGFEEIVRRCFGNVGDFGDFSRDTGPLVAKTVEPGYFLMRILRWGWDADFAGILKQKRRAGGYVFWIASTQSR